MRCSIKGDRFFLIQLTIQDCSISIHIVNENYCGKILKSRNPINKLGAIHLKLKYKVLMNGIFGSVVAFLMFTVSKFSTNYFISQTKINIDPKNTLLLTILFYAHIGLGVIFMSVVVLVWEHFFKKKTVKR